MHHKPRCGSFLFGRERCGQVGTGNNADYNKNKHSLLSTWAPGGHVLSCTPPRHTTLWNQKVRIQNRSADAPYASYLHRLNYHKKKKRTFKSGYSWKNDYSFARCAVQTTLLLSWTHVGLVICRCTILNKTKHRSAPAPQPPCLLANSAFGHCSAKEDYKSTRAPTPSPLSSRAKVILLHCERETKGKNLMPSAQLSSDPRVWHLPDGQGAFFGFAQSKNVPKPVSDRHLWKATSGRAFQQSWAVGGGCCHNNLKK